MRMIPGKTKVKVELFKGVTISDILVAAFAVILLSFVVTSSIPGKLWGALGIGILAVLLLVRIDAEPNYVYLLHILRHFSYRRRYERRVSDESLTGEAPDPLAPEQLREMLMDGDTRKDALPPKERKRRLREIKKALKNKKISQEERDALLWERDDLLEYGEAAEYEEPDAGPSGRELKHRSRELHKALKKRGISQEERERLKKERVQVEWARAQRAAEDKDAGLHRRNVQEVIPFTDIQGGFIEYGGAYYGAVLEIPPVEFRFFTPSRRKLSIEQGLGRILRTINPEYAANLVKLERPILYDEYLKKEETRLAQERAAYESGLLSEQEFQARVEILFDRINELQQYSRESKIIAPFYYLVLFESDKRQLENQLSSALDTLHSGGLEPHRLNDKELAVFLRYSNELDFDEREIEKVDPEDYALWAMPQVVDIRPRRVEVDRIVTHNFRVANFPTTVGDAWLAGVFSMPGTKCVIKCKPMDRTKSIRSIDRSLSELRGQFSSTGVDSRRMELQTHIETLSELLATLQQDNESLLEVNIYITAYDIAVTRANARLIQPGESSLANISNMKRTIRRLYQESGMRLNNLDFDQVPAFVAGQISGWDPFHQEGRGIPSNTLAAAYPWIYASVSDKGGIHLGSSGGVPVFVDFFRRDNERVNSNVVILGKSGSGKSYATKSLLANLAADDSKIFILDPENEYTELAANLHGKFINAGNAQQGRLNPFQIITALDDDEGGDTSGTAYAAHLQFLEEFFAQALPDCEKDALEYLNSLVDRMYREKGIDGETDLSRLRPEDYPVFDDLYDTILLEFQRSKNDYIRSMLRVLMNYVAKFSTGGRNATIWNGPSSITTEENFIVFNFQSLLANRNSTIANAQMLLVLKYIDNEIIKNRDYNQKYGLSRKVIVVIDEAHVFIDTKYPAALDFMFQLAKRIRKYNGMQIVITQNIKDFVGSEEIARKSTAIINACQYSLIFSLAPDDMQDLCKLYEKAGGINESEQEQIISAARGQAFAVMGPASRTSFRVETPEGIQALFSQANYESGYFSGPEGRAAWERFLGESRERRLETVLARTDEDEAAEPDEAGQPLVNLVEIDEAPDAPEEKKTSARRLAEPEEYAETSREEDFSRLMRQFSYDAMVAAVRQTVRQELNGLGAENTICPPGFDIPTEAQPAGRTPEAAPAAKPEQEMAQMPEPALQTEIPAVPEELPVPEEAVIPEESVPDEPKEAVIPEESVPDEPEESAESEPEDKEPSAPQEELDILDLLDLYPRENEGMSPIDLMEFSGARCITITLAQLAEYNEKQR